MSNLSSAYSQLGTGSCKSVSVEIDRAVDESHYEVVMTTVDFYLRLRMPSLDPAESILIFLSTHIGKNEFHELQITLSESTCFTLVKDLEIIDRFFLKLRTDSVFLEYTLAGMAGASLMKALLPALREAKVHNTTE
jgi:hypothetical protein